MDRRAVTLSGIFLFALIMSAKSSTAEIRLPKLLSDHAVLQRDAPIRIWGWAEPGATLSIDFHRQHVTTTSDRLGAWVAWLMPEAAGGPYSLTVTGNGNETAKRVDILIGDVWIASGQSNMQMPLAGFPPGAPVKDGPAEIAAANHPNIRLLVVPQNSSTFPLDDQPASWKICTPESAAGFSAVAYFFGRGLAEKERVPIGLIDSTWGGTPADSWISMDAFGHDPALIPAFASRARFAANLAQTEANLAAEKREEEAAKEAGKPLPSPVWHPDPGSWMPSGLYNGMIAPLTRYSIKGFLWYQGETNSAHDRAPYYGELFQALIEDWRRHFAQGDLPFLYAQISSFHSPGEDWGTVRDAQRRTLSLRNTAMAVTLDVGEAENVHPPDKQTVGARLALAARAVAYHEAVPYESPLFREVTSEPGALRVWFDHAEGLMRKSAHLTGFEVAAADHHFVAAQATIDGTTVVVRSEAVGHPVYVRYGWDSFVQDSLYNAAGLPASTFTSEDGPRHD